MESKPPSPCPPPPTPPKKVVAALVDFLRPPYHHLLHTDRFRGRANPRLLQTQSYQTFPLISLQRVIVINIHTSICICNYLYMRTWILPYLLLPPRFTYLFLSAISFLRLACFMSSESELNVCVCVCVRACVRACVRSCECVCVCVCV